MDTESAAQDDVESGRFLLLRHGATINIVVDRNPYGGSETVVNKLLESLSEDEYLLVRETKRARILGLDEDELIKLHKRVRRARNKHVKVYRRAGAGKVEKKKARSAARAANKRNAAKAEAFEDALSKVSRRLAVVARQSALDLKNERLTRARDDAPSFDDGGSGTGKVATPGKARKDSTRTSPGRKKYEASTAAAGARRQTKKDKR